MRADRARAKGVLVPAEPGDRPCEVEADASESGEAEAPGHEEHWPDAVSEVPTRFAGGTQGATDAPAEPEAECTGEPESEAKEAIGDQGL